MSVMPTDRHAPALVNQDSPGDQGLSAALAALPLRDPPNDGWLRLRASLEQTEAEDDQAGSASFAAATRASGDGAATRSLPTGLPTHSWQSAARFTRRQRWLAVAAILALAALIVGSPDAWRAPPAAPSEVTEVNTDAPSGRVAPPSELVATGEDSSQAEALMIESARLQSILSGFGSNGRDAQTLAIELGLVDRMQWIDYLLADPDATAATREVLWRERVQLLTQRVALSQRDSLIAASDAANREVTL
ncbi:MAG: hypothetical protein ACT4NL_02100 [Pseudomarimonas sp.]